MQMKNKIEYFFIVPRLKLLFFNPYYFYNLSVYVLFVLFPAYLFVTGNSLLRKYL